LPTVSHAPTITAQPTTLAPTIKENGVITRFVAYSDGASGVESRCILDIPSAAADEKDQEVDFAYIMNVDSGTSQSFVYTAMDSIAARMHRELIKMMLQCDVSAGQDFYTHQISSLPADLLDSASCTSQEQQDGSDCYKIDAAFTTTIFYLDVRRRNLQTSNNTILDPLVGATYNAVLQSIFDSGDLFLPGVTNLKYSGLTNSASGTGRVSGLGNSKLSVGPGVIAGSVVGAIVGAALIAGLVIMAVAMRRRKFERNEAKPMDITEDVIHDLDELSDRDDVAMMDRSVFMSDDGSFLKGTVLEQLPPKRMALIMNDDESFETSYYDRRSLKSEQKLSKGFETRFVHTKEILDQLQHDEIQAALPRGQRGYKIDDTVDL
jgi:hypothetical protein